jgi:hypothetical protein
MPSSRLSNIETTLRYLALTDALEARRIVAEL